MRKLFVLFFATTAFISVKAQDTGKNVIVIPASYEILYPLSPNPAGMGMMTPTGWGGYKPYVFGFIGGSFPQVYTTKSDLVAAAGFGFGNSQKTVSVSGMINVLNVSQFNTFSGSLIVSRQIGVGTSLSAGALNLFAGKRSDAGASYYLALSHASQTIKSKTPGYSALCYTIGVGSGRFFLKSTKDSLAGRGTSGFPVFGNIAYELFKGFNIIGEWDGINLAAAVSYRPSFKYPAINIGLADLTRNSGDRIRLIASIGYALPLTKK